MVPLFPSHFTFLYWNFLLYISWHVLEPILNLFYSPLDFLQELGLIRKPASFMTSICDERGQELIYAGMPITEVFKEEMGLGGVLGLLWFQRRLVWGLDNWCQPVTGRRNVFNLLFSKYIFSVLSCAVFLSRLPRYACQFIEMCLMVTADHGPAVSGAHNTIVCARAGKDLISSLTSGLLTIVSTAHTLTLTNTHCATDF